jgi:hypothetical protein
MSQKNLKLLIALIVIILAVVLSYFYLGNGPKTTTPKDTSSGDNFFADLLNFGGGKKPTSDTTGDTPADISDRTPGEEIVVGDMKLVRISSMPVAGYTAFDEERFSYVPDVTPETEEGGDETEKNSVIPTAPSTEKSPAVRYVAKQNGNIFQTFADFINERRFSDTLIPSVQEAFFGNSGETVIMRYVKSDNMTIATWSGTLPKDVVGSDSSALNKITGTFLTDNITDISVSPDSNRVFYVFNYQNGAVGVTSTPSGTNKTQVYNGAYSEWLSTFPSGGKVTMTTKPSAFVPGYMYTIDTSRKDFTRVLGNIRGLTTLASPSTHLVLYGDNTMSLFLYNTETNDALRLSVRTLPEKCVWAGNETIYCAVPKYIVGSYPYPDSWYQGEVSFSDDIWKINVGDGKATLVLDSQKAFEMAKKSFEPIDGIRLSLSSDMKYLFFINKSDSYLWELKLE